jgi:hypothetical protein
LKKRTKKLLRPPLCPAQVLVKDLKVFCFFSSEKKAFLFLKQTPRPPAQGDPRLKRKIVRVLARRKPVDMRLHQALLDPVHISGRVLIVRELDP